jgi:hypothetical protein
VREFAGESRDEIAINFNRVDGTHAINQISRERGLPGADFNDVVTNFRIDGFDDAANVGVIDQKVLAEAFTSAMGFVRRAFKGLRSGRFMFGVHGLDSVIPAKAGTQTENVDCGSPVQQSADWNLPGLGSRLRGNDTIGAALVCVSHRVLCKYI